MLSTLVLLVFIPFTLLIGQELATISVKAELAGEHGRSLVNVRNHHLIVDSPPPLGGPNEEINPIEILLSALGSCAVLVSQQGAKEMGMSLEAAEVEVSGILDPRGVKGEEVNPRIQKFMVKLALTGVSTQQVEQLSDAIKRRCPVFTTLERSAPIEMNVEVRQ